MLKLDRTRKALERFDAVDWDALNELVLEHGDNGTANSIIGAQALAEDHVRIAFAEDTADRNSVSHARIASLRQLRKWVSDAD